MTYPTNTHFNDLYDRIINNEFSVVQKDFLLNDYHNTEEYQRRKKIKEQFDRYGPSLCICVGMTQGAFYGAPIGFTIGFPPGAFIGGMIGGPPSIVAGGVITGIVGAGSGTIIGIGAGGTIGYFMGKMSSERLYKLIDTAKFQEHILQIQRHFLLKETKELINNTDQFEDLFCSITHSVPDIFVTTSCGCFHDEMALRSWHASILEYNSTVEHVRFLREERCVRCFNVIDMTDLNHNNTIAIEYLVRLSNSIKTYLERTNDPQLKAQVVDILNNLRNLGIEKIYSFEQAISDDNREALRNNAITHQQYMNTRNQLTNIMSNLQI